LKIKEREKGKKKIDRKRERMEREKTLSVKNKERYGENANSTSPERLKCYAYRNKYAELGNTCCGRNLKNLRSCHLWFMPRGSKIREEKPPHSPQDPIGISHSCSSTCA